jgi:hypothetical protein
MHILIGHIQAGVVLCKPLAFCLLVCKGLNGAGTAPVLSITYIYCKSSIDNRARIPISVSQNPFCSLPTPQV